MSNRIRCCCCSRQITHNGVSNKQEAPLPAKAMGPRQYICRDCGSDLDEFGLFPEDRAILSREEYHTMYGSK